MSERGRLSIEERPRRVTMTTSGLRMAMAASTLFWNFLWQHQRSGALTRGHDRIDTRLVSHLR